MKITCLNCGVEYQVEDSQIKPQGTKVRCSECNEIFMAYPPVSAQGTSALSAECPIEITPTHISEPAPPIQFTESVPPQTHDFEIPSPAAEATSFAAGMSGEPSYLRIDDEVEKKEEAGFQLNPEEALEKPAFMAETSSTDSFKKEPPWSQAPSAFMDALPPKTKASGFKVFGHVLLVLLLIVLVTIACLLVSMRFFHVQLPPWAQKVVELPVLRDLAQIQPHTGPTVALVKGSGSVARVRNVDGMPVLIVTGEVQNISKTAQGFLTADVQLYQKGTPVLVAAQSFYCGNEMEIEEIKSTPFLEVQEIMQQPFGKNRINAKVLPNERIKFMAIMNAPKIPVDIVVQAGAAKPIPE